MSGRGGTRRAPSPALPSDAAAADAAGLLPEATERSNGALLLPATTHAKGNPLDRARHLTVRLNQSTGQMRREGARGGQTPINGYVGELFAPPPGLVLLTARHGLYLPLLAAVAQLDEQPLGARLLPQNLLQIEGTVDDGTLTARLSKVLPLPVVGVLAAIHPSWPTLAAGAAARTLGVHRDTVLLAGVTPDGGSVVLLGTVDDLAAAAAAITADAALDRRDTRRGRRLNRLAACDENWIDDAELHWGVEAAVRAVGWTIRDDTAQAAPVIAQLDADSAPPPPESAAWRPARPSDDARMLSSLMQQRGLVHAPDRSSGRRRAERLAYRGGRSGPVTALKDLLSPGGAPPAPPLMLDWALTAAELHTTPAAAHEQLTAAVAALLDPDGDDSTAERSTAAVVKWLQGCAARMRRRRSDPPADAPLLLLHGPGAAAAERALTEALAPNPAWSGRLDALEEPTGRALDERGLVEARTVVALDRLDDALEQSQGWQRLRWMRTGVRHDPRPAPTRAALWDMRCGLLGAVEHPPSHRPPDAPHAPAEAAETMLLARCGPAAGRRTPPPGLLAGAALLLDLAGAPRSKTAAEVSSDMVMLRGGSDDPFDPPPLTGDNPARRRLDAAGADRSSPAARRAALRDHDDNSAACAREQRLVLTPAAEADDDAAAADLLRRALDSSPPAAAGELLEAERRRHEERG